MRRDLLYGLRSDGYKRALSTREVDSIVESLARFQTDFEGIAGADGARAAGKCFRPDA